MLLDIAMSAMEVALRCRGEEDLIGPEYACLHRGDTSGVYADGIAAVCLFKARC